MTRLLGPIMIVAGTSIGIGMLTIPALIASAGMFYGAVATVVVWLVMWSSARALAEVAWNLPLGTNMLTMSEKTLGFWGKVVMCSSYILLLYSLSAAYLSSLAAISQYLFSVVGQWIIYVWILFLGIILVAKFQVLDFFNRVLMIFMITSFLTLVLGLGLSHSHVNHMLIFGNNMTAISASTVLVTAFGFQIVVPSLHKTLGNNNPKLMKSVLLWGSLIPLAFYLIWIFVMMQQVDQATFAAMLKSGQPVALLPAYMAKILSFAWVKPVCLLLVIAAVLTSWLGVSISILDFFRDSKVSSYSILLTLLPPLMFVDYYPNGFLLALKYSGYLVAILLIILPGVMLLRFRKNHQTKHNFINTITVFGTIIFGLLILFL